MTTPSIRVTPEDLDPVVNIIDRGAFEITSRLMGGLQQQGGLPASAWPRAAESAEYSDLLAKMIQGLQNAADALTGLAKATAAAADGYVVTDQQVHNSLFGTPTSGLSAGNPLAPTGQQPGVPDEYAPAPTPGAQYTTTTYHIAPDPGS